jgi:hypothetical protein
MELLKKHLLLTIFLTFSTVAMLYIAWQREEVAMRYVVDDAFYYMQIARNIANGHGVTFDGITKTNGFHPLWLLMLIPIYIILPDSPGLAMSVCLSLSITLYTTAVIILYLTLRKYYTSIAIIIGLIAGLLNPLMLRVWIYALEGSLRLFLISLIIWYFSKHRKILITQKDYWSELILGALLGLLFLARLNDAYFALVIGLFIVIARFKMGFYRQNIIEIIRKGTTIFIPFATLVVPYLLWNLINFNNLLPVHGAIKSHPHWPWTALQLTWHRIIYAMRNVPLLNNQIIFLPLIVISIGIIIYLLFSKSKVARQLRQTLKQFDFYILFVAIHSFSLLIIIIGYVHHWYVVPEVILGTILVSAIISSIVSVVPKRVGLIIVGFIMIFFLSGYGYIFWIKEVKRLSPDNCQPFVLYQIANWLNNNTSSDTIIGMWDAGTIGYFTNRRVINLDGLVNNYDFLHNYLKRGNIEPYLVEKRVNLIVQYFWECHGNILPNGEIVSEKYELVRSRLGQVLYYLPFYDLFDGKGYVFVWEYNESPKK